MQKRVENRNKKRVDLPYYASALTNIRLHLELTQSALAEELGITTAAVSLIESGKNVPRQSTLTKWLALVGNTLQERADIISSICDSYSKNEQTKYYSVLLREAGVDAMKILSSEAADDAIAIVNDDLASTGMPPLSAQSVSKLRACFSELAEKVSAAR